MLILGIVAAAVAAGAFLGWVVALIVVSAQMSLTQQRMQRTARYWQAQTALAREQARAERRARQAVTQEYQPEEPDDVHPSRQS
jgi:hypothetical protein